MTLLLVELHVRTACAVRFTPPLSNMSYKKYAQNVRDNKEIPVKGSFASVANDLRWYTLLCRAGGDDAKSRVGLDVPQLARPGRLFVRLQYHCGVVGLL